MLMLSHRKTELLTDLLKGMTEHSVAQIMHRGGRKGDMRLMVSVV